MRVIAAIIVSLTLSASALAQTAPNPVLEHFRAYRAAIAAGDMAAAETAAAAALAASEARDGDGGRTAVLALNLASLRLELGDRAGAVAPATRAQALATRADAGVDPLVAQLVVARASLSADVAGKDAFQTTLAQAQSRTDLAGDVYLAAIDLGRQELTDRRFPEAARAWGVARDTSHAAQGDARLARANALTARAAALIYESMGRRTYDVQPTEIEAKQLLIEARTIALERRSAYRAGAEPDEADRAYGGAMAWELALESLLGRLRRPWTPWQAAPIEGERGHVCPYRIDIGRRPVFPGREGNASNVGAVVVQLQTNEAGEVVRRDLLGAAPGRDGFTSVVGNVMDTWTVDWERNPPDGCTRAARLPAPFMFVQ